MTLMCASAADSGNFDDEAWRAQRATYDLLDREKMLLKADDELGQRIYDIKQNIKTLSEALNTSQSERDRVRHELIIVRVKLLH
jgi:hypothetical protein